MRAVLENYKENGRLNIPQITNSDATATANTENNERLLHLPVLGAQAHSHSGSRTYFAGEGHRTTRTLGLSVSCKI